ncbi:MAG: hypothetical protein Q3960_03410 [Lactobacillus sp.]|nr:hypothetical protein [Lactobacillus sp.]
MKSKKWLSILWKIFILYSCLYFIVEGIMEIVGQHYIHGIYNLVIGIIGALFLAADYIKD